MPKLDLTRARQMKTQAGEVLQLKGPGFAWAKPLRPEIRVSNGAISTFTRDGVAYTQIQFNTSGSFVVTEPVPGARYALVGGGGGGGRAGGTNPAPGAGGAGGFKDVSTTLPAGTFFVGIGGGGGPPATNVEGTSGSPTTISGPITDAIAGGGGGGGITTGRQNGLSGGSGGGGSSTAPGGGGGAATAGSPGGTGFAGAGSTGGGGGGGGAGQAGSAAVASNGGKGGDGILLSWIDNPIWVAGGGGGRSAIMGANGLGGGTTSRGGGTQSTSAGIVPDVGGLGLAIIVFPSASATAVPA